MARVLIGNVRQPVEELLAYFAPAGYGLGTDILDKYITLEELDNTFVNGLYWVTCTGSIVDGQVYNYALARVSGNGTTHSIQELFPLGLDKVLVRRCFEGTWATEWDQLVWKSYLETNGLGAVVCATPTDADANQITKVGFFQCYRNTPIENENWYIIPLVHVKGVYEHQVAIRVTDGSRAERTMNNGVWGEWERVNPPMTVDVEYRTTERYMDKPVYAKLVDCHGCPGTESKTITHNEVGVVDKIVSAQGQLDYHRVFPSSVIGGTMKLDIETTATDIILYSTADYLKDSPCYVLLKYTKV